MRSMDIVEGLITERWPDLKKKAEKETDHERLIAILTEIDDLLFVLEKRIAASDENMKLIPHADARSDWRESCGEVRLGNPGIRSQ